MKLNGKSCLIQPFATVPPYNRQFEQLAADTSDVTPGEAHLAAVTAAKR